MTKVTEQQSNDFNVLNNEFTKYFEVVYLENNDLTKVDIDSLDLSNIQPVHFPFDTFAEKEEQVDTKVAQVEKMANRLIKTAMKQALVEGTVYAPNGTVKLDYYAEHPQSTLETEEDVVGLFQNMGYSGQFDKVEDVYIPSEGRVGVITFTPAVKFSTVNTPAKPIYVFSYKTESGIEINSESNFICIVTGPVVKVSK